jgi:hypothetical protein
MWLVALSTCFIEVPEHRTIGAGGNGTGGAGGGGCPAPSADCDTDGACETDTDTNADHCGACNHGCLGASCVIGRCQPIVLRSGQSFPHVVTVDDRYVFWTTGGVDLGNGTVMRVNKDGTNPIELVTGAPKPRGITLDEMNVYWTDGYDGSLHRVPKGGGADAVLAPGGPAVNPDEGDVVLDGGRVYWTHTDAGLIFAADLDGGNATTLVSGEIANELAVLDGMLYFTGADGGLKRLPIGGGAIEVFTSPSDLPAIHYSSGIATTADTVFFRESDYGGGTLGRAMRFDVGTETIALLASSPGARAMSVDASHAYWTSDKDGTVSKVALDGSDLVHLADGQDDPTGIAVDDEAVYWTNRALANPGAGTVLKVAK